MHTKYTHCDDKLKLKEQEESLHLKIGEVKVKTEEIVYVKTGEIKKEFKLTRQLVHGTLEVHPLKDYGAIEIGTHQFRHIENGKEEVGTFKFLMIWQKKDNQWRISRVVSYDH